MTDYPSWTPAPRPGIVPLRPLGFGTVLGASFTALRQNPRVLLGFALAVQVVSFLILVAAVGTVSFWAFSRLQTVAPSSPDYDTIVAGSFAVVLLTGFVLGLLAGILSIVVQGIVVAEVARAALAERPRLAELWHQVRPVLGRLIGFSLLVTLVVVLAVAAATGLVMALGALSPVAVIVAIVLIGLGAIVLALWLSTKLLLVTPVLVLEHATIRGALARSWRLTRTRFWPILGVIVVVQLIFGFIAQAVSIPFSLFGGVIAQLLAPTADPGTVTATTLVVAVVLPQIVSLLIQSIGIIVQATATSLLYLDCRMRHEGLDQDLLGYVERREAGMIGAADPFTVSLGRMPAPAVTTAGAPAGAPAPAPAPASAPASPEPAPSATQWAAPHAVPPEDERP